jgi:hypothetical protein
MDGDAAFFREGDCFLNVAPLEVALAKLLRHPLKLDLVSRPCCLFAQCAQLIR